MGVDSPVTVRTATEADHEAIADIGDQWDAHDGPTGNSVAALGFIATHGRLLVAVDDGHVVGFGGMVPVRGAAMITDLFVTAERLGEGIGGRLADALVEGHPQRLTFSSAHAAAVPTYVRRGLTPRWHLRYLDGLAAHADSPLSVVPIELAEWGDDRPELAAHWHAQGGRLMALLDVRDDRVGTAVVVPEPAGWSIPRLTTTADHAHAMAAVVASIPAGEPVSAWVPEWSSAAVVLDELDFVETDADLYCSTDLRLVRRCDVGVHPGFC